MRVERNMVFRNICGNRVQHELFRTFLRFLGKRVLCKVPMYRAVYVYAPTLNDSIFFLTPEYPFNK